MKSGTRGTRLVAFAWAMLLLFSSLAVLLPSPVYAEDTASARTPELTVMKDEDGLPCISENTIAWRLRFFPTHEAPKTWYIALSEGSALDAVQDDGEWDRAAQSFALERLYSNHNESPAVQIDERAETADVASEKSVPDATDFVQRLWRLNAAEQIDLLGEEGAAAAQDDGVTIYGLNLRDDVEPIELFVTTETDEGVPAVQMTVGAVPRTDFPNEADRQSEGFAQVQFLREEPEDTNSVESLEPDSEEGGVKQSEENTETEEAEEAEAADVSVSSIDDDTMNPESESKEYIEHSEHAPNAGRNRNEDSSQLDSGNDDVEGNSAKVRNSMVDFLSRSVKRTTEAFGTSAQMAPAALVDGPQAEGGGKLGLAGLRGTYSWSAKTSYDPETGKTYIDWIYTVFSNRLNSSAYVDFTLPTNLEIDETTIQVTNGSWRKDESRNLYYAFSPRQDNPNMTITFRTTITDWSSDSYEVSFRPASKNSNIEWPILVIDWHQKQGKAYFPTAGIQYDEPAPDNLSADVARLTIHRDIIINSIDQEGRPVAGAMYKIMPNDITVQTADEGYIVIPGSHLPIGNTYTIEQISSPEGYGPAVTNPQEITLLFGAKEVVFVSRTLGDIRVNLKKAGTTQDLAGGEFELWTTGPDPRKLYGPASTDANGNAVFSDIEHGLEYEIRQTKAPNGMAPITQPIVVSHEGTVGSVTNVAVTNEPLRIFVTLQNPDGDPISESTLVLKDASGNVVGEALTTDASGKITFMGEYIVYGDSYTVEPTSVPEGYVIAAPQSVKVELATTERLFISPWKATLSVQLTNADSHPLLGGVFLLKNDETGEEIEQTTAADGQAAWENLAAGTYSLKQKRAPNRHIPDPHTYTVIVDEDGRLKVTLNSEELPDRPLPIENQPMTQFPATGGIGKEIFMTTGFVLMAGTWMALRSIRTESN